MTVSALDGALRAWSLVLAGSELPSTASRVVPVTRQDGSPGMLKVVGDRAAFAHEVTALRWYGGHGAARLIEADAATGAMLLERIEPGHSLVELVAEDDDGATMATAAVMGRLWRREGGVAEPPALPSIGEDVRALERLRDGHEGGTGPLPADLVSRAETLAADLERSTLRPVVLHGDLHHGNVLSHATERWVAIDPKGRMGDPAAEAAALLRNPLPVLLTDPDPTPRLTRRVDLLSELLQIPRDRLIGWGVVLATVAACWQLEDEGAGWEPWVRVAMAIGRVG